MTTENQTFDLNQILSALVLPIVRQYVKPLVAHIEELEAGLRPAPSIDARLADIQSTAARDFNLLDARINDRYTHHGEVLNKHEARLSTIEQRAGRVEQMQKNHAEVLSMLSDKTKYPYERLDTLGVKVAELGLGLQQTDQKAHLLGSGVVDLRQQVEAQSGVLSQHKAHLGALNERMAKAENAHDELVVEVEGTEVASQWGARLKEIHARMDNLEVLNKAHPLPDAALNDLYERFTALCNRLDEVDESDHLFCELEARLDEWFEEKLDASDFEDKLKSSVDEAVEKALETADMSDAINECLRDASITIKV